MTVVLSSPTQLLETPQAADGRFFYNPELDSLRPGAHLINTQQFTSGDIAGLFLAADELQRRLRDPGERRNLATRYIGSQLCSLFYEPSTRTRLSFEQAATKLGVGVVSTENAREFSSAAKGETIEDTVRVLDEYDFDVIVLRHHETGAAERAAHVSKTPIVNAGDGKGEHPTQALLDIYTIQREKGKLDGLHVVMGGDLKHGRTVRSLAQLLARFPNNHVSFVSTPELRMEEDVLMVLDELGTTYDETLDMESARADVFAEADVVYWTRTQTERFGSDQKTGVVHASEQDHGRVDSQTGSQAAAFIIDAAALDTMRSDAVIMHPLPRVWEIAQAVDDDARAVYFRQAGNGLYVRMALLDMLMGGQQ